MDDAAEMMKGVSDDKVDERRRRGSERWCVGVRWGAEQSQLKERGSKERKNLK